jgi:hypothetical protein
MGINRKAISLKEGSVYVNGTEIIDAAKLSIVYTPVVSESRRLSSKGVDRRYIGRDITGTLDEYRSTKWLREVIDSYELEGITPELTIQGIREDKDSDFYSENGEGETVTVTGAVLTGDLNLIDLDTDGELVKDSIAFGAKNMV